MIDCPMSDLITSNTAFFFFWIFFPQKNEQEEIC